MNRWFAVTLYLRDPASLATVELRPSAPTTSPASSSCSAPLRATRTPTTRPRSLTSAVTVAPIQASAPASRAASIKMGSSSSRRTDSNPPASPGQRGQGTRARNSSCRRSMWLMTGAPVASTAFSTPSRLRNASAGAWKVCVDSVSRGNLACSTSATDSPPRASSAASGEPAHRPPTTTTSNSLPIGSSPTSFSFDAMTPLFKDLAGVHARLETTNLGLIVHLPSLSAPEPLSAPLARHCDAVDTHRP
jgi:hypothetical protein